LSELDLELALASAGVASKDVEDELGAVENAAGQSGLEVAQLRGRKVVIEENEIGLRRSGDSSDLFNFAGTNECSGVWSRAALNKFGSDLASGAQEQFAKLGERFFGVEAGSVGAGRIAERTNWGLRAARRRR
jgi:hypothetical protein